MPTKILWFRIGFVVLANTLLPIANFFFAAGFFPYKPFLPGRNQFDANDRAIALKAPFDKIIFIVVDALRR